MRVLGLQYVNRSLTPPFCFRLPPFVPSVSHAHFSLLPLWFSRCCRQLLKQSASTQRGTVTTIPQCLYTNGKATGRCLAKQCGDKSRSSGKILPTTSVQYPVLGSRWGCCVHAMTGTGRQEEEFTRSVRQQGGREQDRTATGKGQRTLRIKTTGGGIKESRGKKKGSEQEDRSAQRLALTSAGVIQVVTLMFCPRASAITVLA